jgi:hypothetical protein
VRLWPRSSEGRILAGIAAVIVALNVLAIGIDALVPSPEGPRSSSFATSPEGVAAWAELARRSGREVQRLRERPSADSLPAGGTVVVLDPDDFTTGQARALRAFAERGGRVVAGGLDPGPWLATLAGGARWAKDGSPGARVLAQAPETGQAEQVRTAGEGHWRAHGDGRAVVGGTGGAVVLVRPAGSGRISLVADPSPLQNRLLDRADNASLALGLSGPGPITFVESVHGYGTATGLAALPARFRWALVLLALAAVVLIAARWPRLGPPAPPDEPLFPPRRAYVDGLAATLAKSHDRRAAIESVRAAARERLARTPAALDEEEQRALEEGIDDDGIAAGRALAKLSGGGRNA